MNKRATIRKRNSQDWGVRQNCLRYAVAALLLATSPVHGQISKHGAAHHPEAVRHTDIQGWFIGETWDEWHAELVKRNGGKPLVIDSCDPKALLAKSQANDANYSDAWDAYMRCSDWEGAESGINPLSEDPDTNTKPSDPVEISIEKYAPKLCCGDFSFSGKRIVGGTFYMSSPENAIRYVTRKYGKPNVIRNGNGDVDSAGDTAVSVIWQGKWYRNDATITVEYGVQSDDSGVHHYTSITLERASIKGQPQ